MSYLPGKFVWFELVSRDAKKAQAFYGEVLGWKVEAFPMGSSTYEMIKTGTQTIGGYAPPPTAATPPHWISYVSVDDVDATAKKVVAAGGKIIEAPSDIPTVGRSARVADPQGAQLCLYRSAKGEETDAPPANGSFAWNELWTSDAAAALAFYTKVFGYTDKPMDMGPEGTYHVLEKDGVSRAGLMASTKAGVPPMWLPYVAVADADAAAERTRRLGGAVHVPPSDIPGIGRFAVLADPAGAAFAVLKAA
jgi:predicted enzyme related to lactoylglutathione lyase